MYIFKLLLSFYLIGSFLLSSDNIQFSANFLENIIDDNIEKRIFKNNVIVKKGTMFLYADDATYIPSLGKVILKHLNTHDFLKL